MGAAPATAEFTVNHWDMKHSCLEVAGIRTLKIPVITVVYRSDVIAGEAITSVTAEPHADLEPCDGAVIGGRCRNLRIKPSAHALN